MYTLITKRKASFVKTAFDMLGAFSALDFLEDPSRNLTQRQVKQSTIITTKSNNSKQSDKHKKDQSNNNNNTSNQVTQ